MTKSLFPLVLAYGLLAGALPAFAHSGDGPPLFVAENGKDRGECVAPDSPCATLSYALNRVNKGGEIRVAGGRFEIRDPGDLFQVVSGVVTVRGGFSAADGYETPGMSRSTLVGVPAEYRGLFASKGFHVIADQKANDSEAPAARKFVQQHRRMQAGLAAEPCSGGLSGGLACDNVELLAHVPLSSVSGAPSSTTDIWGFVDLNTDREYAIVGYSNGTAVFDVSDPSVPREVGFIDGQNANWRDVKVHQRFDEDRGRWHAWAYVSTDGSTDGLFVIDLGGLPHSVARAGYGGDFSAAHNVYPVHTDFGTGLSLGGADPTLVIAGANVTGGRFRPYSLASPAAPVLTALPDASNSDYMHDAASVVIYDERKDTQCVNATDYCEILFDFNESTVDIWDLTDPGEAVRLSRTPYDNASYTHSGWPSEDGRYLFVHDELDERNAGLRTTVRVFSLADLVAPVLAGSWTGPTSAIDHNGFVRGNRYYLSNYSRGLTILDISDPAQPSSIGRLDTYPFSDNSGFVGAWGVYPYFHSGVLAISDISSGLYLAADQTLENAAGTLSFDQQSYSATEGAPLTVTVERTGGSAGPAGVEVRLLPGTADTSDFGATVANLAWADGDSAPQSFTWQPVADGTEEGLERALLQLAAPAGGATLAANRVTSLYVADPGATASVGFDATTIEMSERGFATAVFVVTRSGSAEDDASVDYAVTGGTATAGADYNGPAAGTIRWAAGDARPKSIEYQLLDDGAVEDTETLQLELTAASGATLGSSASATLEIHDGDGANQAPNALAGASQTVAPGATVTLSGAASNDSDGDALRYAWQQVAGPDVVLSDSNAVETRFVAPSVASDTLLRFELTVSDPRGLSDTATVNVTVTNQSGNDGFGGSSGGGAVLWLLLLLAAASARRQLIRTGVA